MVSAYIFIHALVGGQANLKEMHEAAHQIPGAKTVHFLAGPTDAVAYVEAADLEALSDTVGRIRGVKGVASTDTRVIRPLRLGFRYRSEFGDDIAPDVRRMRWTRAIQTAAAIAGTIGEH